MVLSRNSTTISISIEDDRLVRRPNPKYPGHDQKGFRNRSVPNKVSIVAMGDSQTYGMGMLPDQAWPQQLEQLGDIKTYNMAFGGYGPAHSLILLAEAIDLGPRLIIEAFYAGNDIYDTFSLVYKRKKLQYLRNTDENIIKRIQNLENDTPLEDHIIELYRAAFGAGVVRELFAEYSKLYGLLRAIKQAYDINIHRYRNQRENSDYVDWEKVKERAIGKGEHTQVFEGGNLKTIFTPKYRQQAVNLGDPRIEEGCRLVLEIFKSINESTKRLGINFVVVLIPTKEMALEKAVNKYGMRMSADYWTLVRDEKRLMEKMLKFFRENDIAFIDLLPVLDDYIRDEKPIYRTSADDHLNAIGQHAIASAILREIRSRNLLRELKWKVKE